MIGFVSRRILAMVGVIIIVSIITFLMFIVVPGGDPAVRLAGRVPTEQNIENIRQEWGFDKPIYVQYLTLMRQTVDGTLTSYVTQTNVQSEIISRLPVTITLAVGTMLVAVFLGTILGVLSAVWAGTARDRLIAAVTMAGVSLPIFWAAIQVRYLLSYKLELLPDGGFVSFTSDPGAWFSHLILPCLVGAILTMAIYSRLLRSSILDTVGEDYVKTAHAKGLPTRTIWTRHVLRNAMLPGMTLVGLEFAAVIGGGTILIETIFDMHGVGQYAAQAVRTVDLPPLMAVTLYGAAAVVIINALVDVLYGWVDPRVRTHK